GGAIVKFHRFPVFHYSPPMCACTRSTVYNMPAAGTAGKAWRSVKRQMRIARQAELAAAEMTEILFWIECDVHRREMNVAPGALDRMRSGEPGSAAHSEQRVDDVDAQFRRARAIAHRPRPLFERGPLRRAGGIDRAAQQQFGGVEVGGRACEPHLHTGELGKR